MTHGEECQVVAMSNRIEDLYYTLRGLERDGLLQYVGEITSYSIPAVIALLTKALEPTNETKEHP